MALKSYANEFVSFLNASTSPYLAVESIKKLLLSSNFTEISERSNWSTKVKKGQSYFVTRNGSSIIAFTVGANWKPGNSFSIVGCHTDSPTLRIKPISSNSSNGYIQVGVECYGGGIFHTFFDRSYGISGRVMINSNDKLIPKIIQINKPILNIPTLAIHLDRAVNQKFEFNKETHLLPIAGLENKAETLDQTKNSNNSKQDETSQGGCSDHEQGKLSDEEFHSLQTMVQRHNKLLIDLIAKECGCEVSAIEDFELILHDTNPSTIGGINDEFIFSGRLDNLTSCFCGSQALVRASKNIENESGIRLLACFDHEEIGSQSAQGADSNFIPAVVDRLSSILGTGEESIINKNHLYQSAAKSFFLSSDMAHGVHPNYALNYESKHKPGLNKGPVIKINANQRYATNSPGILLVKKCAELVKVPLQLFVVRNDSPCGSTIGPIVCSKLGIRCLDIGNPQLSMHSIRETCGTDDVASLVLLFESFWENFSRLEPTILVDAVE
ncbi:aspartyl aminopeptidase [Ascoidea rubescens DSM 1968]|uniref:aspartyl aminopeptidase n=1 Tax=Ascoidea rubescens DSM 1968 TaxID=1344418 RepID=A0A1D2VL27_9ASCO|nr:peptidase M18, aminopeptidase I [Ascoidea rubescens DSM 1968]ODV62304.1 peptidase M18, aminopeptidase I [Ascoidea rubescens DSM 1968]